MTMDVTMLTQPATFNTVIIIVIIVIINTV
jgi:hypothetical protein